MKMLRFVSLVLAMLAAGYALQVPAQDAYPNRPIKIIVPYPAGGGADLVARLIGQYLGDKFKQSVIIENRAGGSNTIGLNAVANSPADGYTLGLVTPVFVMTPSLIKDHPYDPLKDLAPVGMVGFTPLILVVHPGVQAHTVKEFIQLAKTKPGVLNYGSLGAATTQGLAGALFNSMAGIKAVQVPYKGSAPAVTDLLSGTVQYMFNAMPSMIPHLKAGKLRALGVTSAERSPLLPEVPTITESLPGYQVTTWYGLVATAKTPKPVIALLNREITAILKTPEMQERFKGAGIDPGPMTVEAFAALLKTESVKWAKVIADEDIKPE